MLDTLLDYAVQHPEQVVAAATALGATAFHYAKTGSLPLGRLPWRHLRQTVRQLGDQYFGKARPKGVPGLLVDADLATLETELRAAAFESGDLYSYEYHGEDANFRRPAGTRPHPETGAAVPMELHCRAFETGDRLLVLAHHEPNRFEATDAHLAGTMLSWGRGRDRLTDVLDQAGIDYQEIPSERQATVEVPEGK